MIALLQHLPHVMRVNLNVHRENIHTLRTERNPNSGLNCEPWRCEATMLPTAPQCQPAHEHQNTNVVCYNTA